MLLRPSTIGDPIAADIAHTSRMVRQTLRLFLCFAYLIGWVTAIYLLETRIDRGNGDSIRFSWHSWDYSVDIDTTFYARNLFERTYKIWNFSATKSVTYPLTQIPDCDCYTRYLRPALWAATQAYEYFWISFVTQPISRSHYLDKLFDENHGMKFSSFLLYPCVSPRMENN